MATRKKAPARVEVPHRSRGDVTEKDCKAAIHILSQDYYGDCVGVAKDLARQMKEGEVDDFSDTFQAKLAVILSDNADAYFDDFGEEGACTKDGIQWERLAFVAMERDVVKELEIRDVDVNDPRSWPDIDLKEFD